MAKEILMYQCRLQSGNEVKICWLSDEKPFKEGDVITLKDSENPNQLWKVTSKGGKGHPKSDVKDRWRSQDI